MAITKLCRYFDMKNDGDSYSTYTCDSWVIPEAGAEIWCNGWERGQTIRPHGDGSHVFVGYSAYHCDELMSILTRWEQEGFPWGIEGVFPTREQQIDGRWVPVPINNAISGENSIQDAGRINRQMACNEETELER